MTQTLKITRKADRAQMVVLLRELAVRCGTEIEVHHEDTRSITVILRRDDVGMMVNLDATNRQPDLFMGHWNSKRRLDGSFATIIRGTMNTHHFCKATHYGDFAEFMLRAEGGFGAVADGRAFDLTEYEPRQWPQQTPGYPPWNRPDLTVIAYLREAVPDPNGLGASYWLPRDLIGNDGKTAIIYRLASDGEYSINGWEPWHAGMFGGRYENVANALAWVDRAIAVKAGKARDFLGV